MTEPYDYLKDGAEIYRQSFATIQAEADLDQVPPDLRPLAIRMIHASGQVDLLDDLAWSDGLYAAATTALRAGATILCDSRWWPAASSAHGCRATTRWSACSTTHA